MIKFERQRYLCDLAAMSNARDLERVDGVVRTMVLRELGERYLYTSISRSTGL